MKSSQELLKTNYIPWDDFMGTTGMMGKEMYNPIITFTGSRTIDNRFSIYTELDRIMSILQHQYSYYKGDICFVLGGARGLDSIVEDYAKMSFINYTIRKPDWDKHGKRAGMLRNCEMIDVSHMCIAFWDGISSGTQQCFNYAKSKGLKTVVYRK